MTDRVEDEYAGGASSAIMGSRLGWCWWRECDCDWEELKLADVGGEERLDMGLVSRVLGRDLSLQCNGTG